MIHMHIRRTWGKENLGTGVQSVWLRRVKRRLKLCLMERSHRKNHINELYRSRDNAISFYGTEKSVGGNSYRGIA